MKTAISLLLALIMAASVFVGCESLNKQQASSQSDDDTNTAITDSDTNSSVTEDTVIDEDENNSDFDEVAETTYSYEMNLPVYMNFLVSHFYGPFDRADGEKYGDGIVALLYMFCYTNMNDLSYVHYDESESTLTIDGEGLRTAGKMLLGKDFDAKKYGVPHGWGDYDEKTDTYTVSMATDYHGGSPYNLTSQVEPVYVDEGDKMTVKASLSEFIDYGVTGNPYWLEYSFTKVIKDGILYYRLENVNYTSDPYAQGEPKKLEYKAKMNFSHYLHYLPHCVYEPYNPQYNDNLSENIILLVCNYFMDNYEVLDCASYHSNSDTLTISGLDFRMAGQMLFGGAFRAWDFNKALENSDFGAYDSYKDIYTINMKADRWEGTEPYYIMMGTKPHITETTDEAKVVLTVQYGDVYHDLKEPYMLEYTFTKVVYEEVLYYRLSKVKSFTGEEISGYNYEMNLENYFENLSRYFYSPYENSESSEYPDNIPALLISFCYDDVYFLGYTIMKDSLNRTFTITGKGLETAGKMLLGEDFSLSEYNDYLVSNSFISYDEKSDIYTVVLPEDYFDDAQYGFAPDTQRKYIETQDGMTVIATVSGPNAEDIRTLEYSFTKVIKDGVLYYRLDSVNHYGS